MKFIALSLLLHGALAFLAIAPWPPPPLALTRLRAASAPSAADDDADTGETVASLCEQLRSLRAQMARDESGAAAAAAAARGLALADVVTESLLCSRFAALRLRRARVGASALAGRGVFATRALAPGELVTCYPADAIVVSRGRDRGVDGVTRGVIWGAHVDAGLRDAQKLAAEWSTHNELAPFAGGVYSIVGHPELAGDASYLGHFANDAAALDAAAGDGGVEEYEEASSRLANAANAPLEGVHVGVVATRAIAAGDEVLVSYGADFWRTRRGGDGGGAARPPYVRVPKKDLKRLKKKASAKEQKKQRSTQKAGEPRRGFG